MFDNDSSQLDAPHLLRSKPNATTAPQSLLRTLRSKLNFGTETVESVITGKRTVYFSLGRDAFLPVQMTFRKSLYRRGVK